MSNKGLCWIWLWVVLTKHADGLDKKEMRKDRGEEGPSGCQVKDQPGLGMCELCTIRHPFGNLVL